MDKPPPYLFSLPSPCRKLSPAADVIRSPRSANHITHETVYHPQTLGVQSIQQCHDIRPQAFLRLVLTEIKKFVGAHLQCSGNTLQRLKLRVAMRLSWLRSIPAHSASFSWVMPCFIRSSRIRRPNSTASLSIRFAPCFDSRQSF